ncbi:unnamed protein product [Rhodiola kirilowii]
MDPLQPITSSVHNVQMVPVGSVSNMPPVQTLKPNEQLKLLEPMAHYGNASANSSALHMMPGTSYSGVQQLTVPNSGSRDMGAMFTNLKVKAQNVQMPVKRKSPMENLPGYPLSPTEGMQNKKIGQLEHRPWLNIYAPNQSNVQHQVQSLAGVLASQQWAAKKKRTTQFQAGPPKSSFLNFPSPRSHPSQVNPSPRGQNESNESVRSKLRESISAALALVTEKDKSSSKEGATVSAGAIASERTQEGSQSAEIASFVSPAELSVEKPKGENEDYTTQSQSENNVECQLTPIASNLGGSPQTHASVSQELSISDMLPDEESIAGIFFAKDDLLQGNGLAWVSDFDAWVAEKEGHCPKKQKVSENVGGAQEVKKINSPETLALQIEIELFKLFGGVNKKYKEKGRSLLFNLKDKNNPELREKVMSGEIPPARLCSMTPEELASKELSEWRIAKAEEFEHMKILPDSDIDIRRLVKKTHKGEYQVEIEEDDVSVEVSVGSSSFPRIQTEAKETKSPPGQISEGDHKETVNDENNSEERNPDGTITFPSNPSSDLMQGLIEDEFKDAEFLPPIVSLDEFMASLDSEPPFENISADADKTAASLDNYHSEMPSEAKSAKLSPDGHTKSAKLSPDGHTKSAKLSPNGHAKSTDNLDSKDPKLDKDSKPTNNQSQTEVSAPIVVSKGQPQTEVPAPMAVTKGERIWVGNLQLSNSSTISVSGFFKRGEKASTKDWPHTLEIKGRVRMDGFEKFLHDLYKSRSRSIMVMHVILKETEGKESEALNQVVDSYVADDRVGFAEPLRGIEAYLCPTHPKILDRIAKHLAKDHSEVLSLGDGDKGLIGVIVWRKAHVSPNSSSHHKHSLKKHQQEHNNSSSRRHNQNHHQDRNMNMNSSNLKPKHPVVPLVQSKLTTTQIKTVTDEDDVPPGFGPPATQDDDDLPEFNFSSGLTRSVPTQKSVAPQTQNRPVDQMRELIQKYGQNAGSGLVVKPWDDDDDDDIPEWQPPQQPLPPPPQPASTQINYQSINQPLLQHLINQQKQQQQLLVSHLQPPQAALPLPPQFPATQQNVAPGWPQQQQSGRWMNHQAPQSRGF